jgi:hypothetical protein
VLPPAAWPPPEEDPPPEDPEPRRLFLGLERDAPDPVDGAEDPNCPPEEAEPPEPEVPP